MPDHEELPIDRAQLAPSAGEDRRQQDTNPADAPAPVSPQPEWDEVEAGVTKLERIVAG